MEEIQFLNYIFSIFATLLSVYAAVTSYKCEQQKAQMKNEISKLKTELKELIADSSSSQKKRY